MCIYKYIIIFHVIICRITVSENVVNINIHLKEWINPIRGYVII